MASSKSSRRIALFTLLLSMIVLSLFGSLVAADRALSRADREAVDLDAHLLAVVAERELRLSAEDLGELFAPLLPGARLSVPDTTPIPRGFDAVWVINPANAVVWRKPDGPRALADSTLLRLASDSAGWPRVAATNDGVLLLTRLQHRGQTLGSAVGLVAGLRLLESIADTSVQRRWMRVGSGGRTAGFIGARDRQEEDLIGRATLSLPGDRVEFEVAHAQGGRVVRTTLWLLGVLGLIALLAVLARERRQAIQLSERTAELERLYQEVARSNRMKSEFLANVSHELRTPLNAVVGFVEMLREGVYGELTPRQALPVDRIAASGTHLRHLVDRLLDIAKIAAGRLEVNAEPLVLRPFVLNVASEMESLVSERGLALSIGVGPSLPRIRTDQTHLRQILINLIGNAVKYTPSGGIHVRAWVVGNGVSPEQAAEAPDIGPPPDPLRQWIALQVTDTGVGIAEADRERIFDEFEQVNAGARTDSARRGTGLGLAISRRLARLLGGDLNVVSELGRGSTFTVWLPLDPTEPTAP
ncbi:MAG: sensor histidine kinase [Gemmatimonadaceae bacterium]